MQSDHNYTGKRYWPDPTVMVLFRTPVNELTKFQIPFDFILSCREGSTKRVREHLSSSQYFNNL